MSEMIERVRLESHSPPRTPARRPSRGRARLRRALVRCIPSPHRPRVSRRAPLSSRRSFRPRTACGITSGLHQDHLDRTRPEIRARRACAEPSPSPSSRAEPPPRAHARAQRRRAPHATLAGRNLRREHIGVVVDIARADQQPIGKGRDLAAGARRSTRACRAMGLWGSGLWWAAPRHTWRSKPGIMRGSASMNVTCRAGARACALLRHDHSTSLRWTSSV